MQPFIHGFTGQMYKYVKKKERNILHNIDCLVSLVHIVRYFSMRIYTKLYYPNSPCSQVNAYGFITEDYEKYPNYYVEKSVKTPVTMYINHDYILEMKTWQKLHQSKIIKLYQRTDSETEAGQPKSP